MSQLLCCGGDSQLTAYHTFHNDGCSMIGLLFTTTEEAAPFVRKNTDGRIDALGEDAPVQTGDFVVAVTGTGKLKATLATERLLRAYDLEALLHVGPCTALGEEPVAGTLVAANFVLEGDRVELDAPTYPRMPLECPFDVSTEGTLVSQDHTTDDADEESYWERIADVRDDTGYPVAYVAAQHGTPCHVVKVVTSAPDQEDESSSGAKKDAPNVIASFLRRAFNDKSGSEG